MRPNGPSLVTVVMPVYNGARFLEHTLESVFNQTLRAIEIICVDDGSSDRSVKVISDVSVRNGRSVQILQQDRGGQSAARNKGAAIASGQYLAFLDQDDIWYPEKLERQVTALESDPGAVLVHCDHDLIDEEGKIIEHCAAGKALASASRDWIIQLLGPHPWVLPSVIMVRRTSFNRIGGFDPELRFDEDADLSVRMSDEGRFVFIHEVCAAHRVHPQSASRRTDIAEEHFRNGERFCRKLQARYNSDPDKRRLVHLILASKYSDWGWHKVRAGQASQGVRLLARSLMYDPLRLRTYSRLFRSLGYRLSF